MNINIKKTWANIIENKKLDKLIMIISLIVFTVLSLYRVINHVPFFDEVNAWNIAQNFKPWEILEITKREGHMFIWYYLLMPFAQNDIGYPIAMKLINWIFCFGAVLLLWFKAPFNPIIKALITFSMPFQIFYMHARCYSIGMFLLFLACALYKNRMKHPFLYATLLILIANTSVMALFLAFPLGLCFIHDLYIGIKNNEIEYKKLVGIITICSIGAFLVLIQFYNFTTPYYATKLNIKYVHHLYMFFLGYEKSTTIDLTRIILIACYLSLCTFAWNFFDKDKKPFIFLLISLLMYLFLFKYIYLGEFWHYIFFFIIIIIAIWLYLSKYKISQPFQKTYLFLFYVMFFILTFCAGKYSHEGPHKTLEKYMNNLNIKDTKVFFYPAHSHSIGIVNDLKNRGIIYYDSIGNTTNSKDFYIHQYDYPEVNFDKISKILKPNEKAFVFIEKYGNSTYNEEFNNKAIIYTYKHKNLDIKFIEYIDNTYIWRISRIK